MKSLKLKQIIISFFLITHFISFSFLTIIMLNSLNEISFNNLISGYDRLLNRVFYYEETDRRIQDRTESYIDIDWPERLSEGGYIIHIRHATRSSLLTTGYDYYEFITNDFSQFNTYTCLNSDGVAESYLLSWAFQFNNIDFGEIYTSPSCRALEMAIILKNTSEVQIENSLLYLGAVQKSKQQSHKEHLSLFLNSINHFERNVLLVGHEFIVFPDSDINIIDKTNNLERKQGGFSILTFDNSNSTLTIHKTYTSISDFVRDSRK